MIKVVVFLIPPNIIWTYFLIENGDFNKIYNDSIVSVFNENQEYDTDFINKNGYIFAYTRYPVDQSNVDKRLLTIFETTRERVNNLQQTVFIPINTNTHR